jgi:RNA polymerase-binding protein DksA
VAKASSRKKTPPPKPISKPSVKAKSKPAPPVLVKGNAKAHAPPPVPVSKKPIKPLAPKPPRIVEPAGPVIPLAAPVPTDGKPRKNLSGISPRELELYRDQILAKRREIVGDMSSMEREALRASGSTNLSNLPLHMADMGTDNYEQEFTLGLMEKDRKLLRDLNDALAKIQNGTYGLCEGTGKPITKARLEAQPWARYSIEYARKLERHLP